MTINFDEAVSTWKYALSQGRYENYDWDKVIEYLTGKQHEISDLLTVIGALRIKNDIPAWEILNG